MRVSTQILCRVVVVIMTLTMCASAAWAQGKAFVGGTVHTVSGEVIEQAAVVGGEDGLIVAVGEMSSVTIPAGAERVDFAGKIMTPGLFDAHSSLGLVEIDAVKALHDTSSGSDVVNAAYDAGDSFHEHSAVLAIQRTGGVTDVIITPSGGVVQGQGAHVQLAGAKLAQGQVVRGGVAQYIALGSWPASKVGESRGALYGALHDLFEDVDFYIKNERLFNENRSRRLSASPRALRALHEGKQAGQPFVFSASLASDITWALAFAKEQGLKPVILGAEEAWMVLDELKAAQAAVILNPMTNMPDSLESTGARQDNVALCEAAGLTVMLATFSSHNSRRIRQMAGNAVRAGMTPEGALRAVTLTVAEQFGAAKTHGSIEPGKVANIVIWSGDPFEFSSKVEAMYIKGEGVSLENRQRKLFERYRMLERRDVPAPQDQDVDKGDVQ
jgi:imidazolonepropionase-like amidohydrolase